MLDKSVEKHKIKVMDELFEGILELVCDLYLELISSFIPEKKFGKKGTVIIKIICLLMVIVSVGMLIAGVALIDEGHSAGVPLTCVGGSLIGIHILGIIILLIRKYKEIKEKKNEELWKKDDENNNLTF